MNSQDPSNFRQFITDSPSQFKIGFEIVKDAKVNGTFTKVTLSGMGGSALPGNLLRIYLNDLYNKGESLPLPIYQNRYYKLPPEAYDKSLNLIVSYSGNTEETLASFQEAHDAGLSCIGFSSGGKLEEMCKEWDIPHVKLPMPYKDFQPRMGTGYLFSSMYQVLVNHGLIPDKKTEILQIAEKKLKGHLEANEQWGKELAKKLVGKTPVIYASPKFKAVAMVWKIVINENAKTPAFFNFFPELNHNEMIGYTNPQGKFITIMLKDLDNDSRHLARYQATADLIKQSGVESEIITMDGESVFEKMFLSVQLACFTSYYLALEYNQDPTPVHMVEELKKILAK